MPTLRNYNSPKDRYKEALPPINTKDPKVLLAREEVLRKRIIRLESGKASAARRVARFEYAIQQEMELFNATKQKREALGQASSQGTPTGMHVSRMHGSTGPEAEETIQEEAKEKAGRDGRSTCSRPSKLVVGGVVFDTWPYGDDL